MCVKMWKIPFYQGLMGDLIKKILRFLVGILVLVIIVLALIVSYVQLRYRYKIVDSVEDLSEQTFAIVLGAGVLSDGSPSQVLNDRIITAVALYKGGKVSSLLFSGDGVSDENYDETAIMRQQAILQGVRPEDIFTDSKGVRTIKSCERAAQVFGIEKAIIVTQDFHLPRALYLCNSKGIDASGVVADKNVYLHIRNYQLREIPASVIAFWESNVGTFSAIRVDMFQRMFTGLF